MEITELWKECLKGDEHHKDESFKYFVSVLIKQMQLKDLACGSKSVFPKNEAQTNV